MRIDFALIGIAILFASSEAHAAHELQVGASAFTGTYSGASSTTPFEGRLRGYGLTVDYAPSFRLSPSMLLGGEAGVGLYSGGGKLSYGRELTMLASARAGVRTQLHGDGWFVGASLGLVRFAVGTQGPDIQYLSSDGRPIGHNHPREQTGAYGSLYGGIRGNVVGLFGRLDVTRTFDKEARFTPIALTIGVNLAWL